MNRVEIVGGVANDPVFKTAKNDRPYAILNVITNSRLRLANGEYRDQVCGELVIENERLFQDF